MNPNKAEAIIKQLNFSKMNGLITIVAQDWKSNEILMVAWANEEAIRKSLTTGLAHYFSRSHQKLWLKGETSGHLQRIKEVYIDCDGDSVLFKVEQEVAACHMGYRSCFYQIVANDGSLQIVGKKLFNPSKIY